MPVGDNNILATTVETWIRKYDVDAFFRRSDATLGIWKNLSGRDRVDGGDEPSWSIFTAGSGNPVGIDLTSNAPTFGVETNPQVRRKPKLQWKTKGRQYDYPKQDFDVFNKGEGRVINLLKGNLDNIMMTAKDVFARDLWETAPGANDPVSLSKAIGDFASTYAGIDPGVVTSWSPYNVDLANATITVQDCADAIMRLRVDRAANIDAIVCGFDVYSALQAEANGAIRHPNVRTGVRTELNVDTFSISGVPVIADPFLDAEPANGAVPAGNSTVYFLDYSEIAMIPQPADPMDGLNSFGEFFRIDGPSPMHMISQEHTYKIHIEWTLILAVLNRRKQGVIINAGA